MRQNLLLRYKYKTQNVIDELVRYPLSTLSCSQKGTFLSSRILEIFFLRLRVLAGSIFGLIKGPQICSDVHKSRSPYRHRGEGDAESSEKSVEANMSSRHLWEADLHKECSLNQSCPYSSGKPCPPRKHENLGSRNRISAHCAGVSVRSPNINSSVHIPEFTCTRCLSHRMSPSLHRLCIHQLWQAVKKMLTSLAKSFSLFLTTCATHSFQPQWFPFSLPLPPPCMDPQFFISHTPLLFLFFTRIPTVSISLSLSHTYVLLGRAQSGKHEEGMEAVRYKHSHSLDSVWRDFELSCRSGFMSYSVYLSVKLLESNSALPWGWAGIHQKELNHGVWKRRLKWPLNIRRLWDPQKLSCKKARDGFDFGVTPEKTGTAGSQNEGQTTSQQPLSDGFVCACRH